MVEVPAICVSPGVDVTEVFDQAVPGGGERVRAVVSTSGVPAGARACAADRCGCGECPQGVVQFAAGAGAAAVQGAQSVRAFAHLGQHLHDIPATNQREGRVVERAHIGQSTRGGAASSRS